MFKPSSPQLSPRSHLHPRLLTNSQKVVPSGLPIVRSLRYSTPFSKDEFVEFWQALFNPAKLIPGRQGTPSLLSIFAGAGLELRPCTSQANTGLARIPDQQEIFTVGDVLGEAADFVESVSAQAKSLIPKR